MLCKGKITSIFCIIDDILKEINHSEDIPPLAQACRLCPIQNSKFSPRPTYPTYRTRPTCRTRPICPTCPTRPTIQNSEFKIYNLPIPLALFRVHYRLKKRLYLWWIKENSRVILLYYID